MSGLDFGAYPDLLVGLGRPDDAGVYRLTDDIALVQTVDFFTPIVDDPFTFGQIAAANALSDVYAMGGTPLTALNVVCFPSDTMELGVLKEILKGGLEKTKEAECALVGGHSVKAPELKYGLSVTGIVHPQKVLANRGGLPGDALVLTKKLGTGIVTTAIKGESADAAVVEEVSASMCELNRDAAVLSRDLDVHALTDITGFGLLGHGVEMIEGLGLGMEIQAATLPLFPEVEAYASKGFLPGGLHQNRKHFEKHLCVDHGLAVHFYDIICDPQTSGGLLFALGPNDAEALLERLRGQCITATLIGRLVADKTETMVLK
jgi:selenide,water dikinase